MGLIGLLSDGLEFPLAVPRKLLTSLASAALTAKGQCDAQSPPDEPPPDEQVETFHCEKWEFGLSADGMTMVLGFRLRDGGWVRLQAPRQWSPQLRQTLETIETRPMDASSRTAQD